MSFFTRLRDAVTGSAKAATKNKTVVASVLSVVLGAAGVANYEKVASVATNIYCSALVKCDV